MDLRPIVSHVRLGMIDQGTDCVVSPMPYAPYGPMRKSTLAPQQTSN
jgi:hypothetical protein